MKVVFMLVIWLRISPSEISEALYQRIGDYISKTVITSPLLLYVFTKERCQAKYLEGHLTELGLLIGPHKSARFVWANQEA